MKTTQSTKKMRQRLHEHVRVMAFGTFDILHPGHLHYLNGAKKLGNELIVVVARDSTVEKIKGKFPINHEDVRVQMVSALKVVDKAVQGNKGVIYDILEEIKPDVIALGYDQHINTEKLVHELELRKLNCKVVRLKAFSPKKFKSSIIKRRIRVS